MAVQTHWRLALMFDTKESDLADALSQFGPAIRAAALGHLVRMGVADRHIDLGDFARRDPAKGYVDVDGAIEVSVANDRIAVIPTICASLKPLMADFCDLASVHIMTGPTHNMVPVREGGTFLSLAFRRDPANTSAMFRDWWYNRHSKVAIPVLGDGLLAYDQVHVEQAPSLAAAKAFGADYVEYDAYDNLTWVDRYGFLHSLSDTEAMLGVYADEVGQIDPIGRRSAIMTEIG
ncbi:MAG: hypothetical protein RLZZ136_1761 [Pseudomonadota bacterium]|jgi:hypothetical protein